jgi:adenylate cyclase
MRIGINLGDVIFDDTDIFGDGVNVAARLEGLAEPGGICVSGTVHEHVRTKLDIAFEDLGEQQVKNITRPVRSYRIVLEPSVRGAPGATTLPYPDKPSIAVLPFVNMSGDPEQEYFADGMVDEIITSLSRLRWLIVIARTSSFMYKGRSVDVRSVGQELGVRYVLEGSVRKSGDRVRIIGQLIDTRTGEHLWADRFEGDLANIFDLQDRITDAVTGAIEPNLRSAEIERAKRKRPENLDAYDYYLRALPSAYRPTPEAFAEAIALLEKAYAIDRNYAPANALGAWFYFYRVAATWSTTPGEDRANAVRLAHAAIDADENDPFALSMGGFLLASMGRDVAAGLAAAKRAVEISPNSASVLHSVGWTLTFTGDQDKALEYLQASLRLGSSDPLAYRTLTGAAAACVLAGRFVDAVAFGEEARRRYAKFGPTFRFLAAAYAQLGRTEKAAEALSHLYEFEPTVTVSHLRSFLPYQDAIQAQRLWDGLRKAGMPE